MTRSMAGQATTRPDADACGRVRAVLLAARRIVDRTDPLGREARRDLPAVTGLSVASVELALSRHLETEASDDQIRLLVSRTTPAPRTHVVLSANVFVASARALALALSASPTVCVRASRREPVMARLLVRALGEQAPALALTEVDGICASAGEQVHVYGRDESIRAIAQALPAGALLWAHGPGMGIAVVGDSDDACEAAELLSWDVVAFDQRGCLSPRLVLWTGSRRGAEAFGHALSDALEARASQVPRGRLDEREVAQASLLADAMRMVGKCWQGPSSTVGLDLWPQTASLFPPGRNIQIACVDPERPLPAWLTTLERFTTTLGALSEHRFASALAHAMPRARRARLGTMQRPPFDGPVDLRSEMMLTPAPCIARERERL